VSSDEGEKSRREGQQVSCLPRACQPERETRTLKRTRRDLICRPSCYRAYLLLTVKGTSRNLLLLPPRRGVLHVSQPRKSPPQCAAGDELAVCVPRKGVRRARGQVGGQLAGQRGIFVRSFLSGNTFHVKNGGFSPFPIPLDVRLDILLGERLFSRGKGQNGTRRRRRRVV